MDESKNNITLKEKKLKTQKLKEQIRKIIFQVRKVV